MKQFFMNAQPYQYAHCFFRKYSSYVTPKYIFLIDFDFRAVLNIVAFLQLFTIAICHILRLKCKGEADFVIRESGRRLLGTPIFTHEGMNLQDCYKQCYHQPECKSVNINAADGSGVCELMSKSSFNVKDKVTLTDSVGWEYHTTNFSSRLVSIANLNKSTKGRSQFF